MSATYPGTAVNVSAAVELLEQPLTLQPVPQREAQRAGRGSSTQPHLSVHTATGVNNGALFCGAETKAHGNYTQSTPVLDRLPSPTTGFSARPLFHAEPCRAGHASPRRHGQDTGVGVGFLLTLTGTSPR